MTRDPEDVLCRRGPVEMEEDAEYRRQLDLFVRCSTEKSIELVKLGEIMAGLRRRRTFLDVGAGGGNLTIPISQSFGETVVVEPNEEQAAFFRRRRPDFTVHESSWSDARLDGKSFDFILCSHVLYYIEEGAWLDSIRKMHSHLNPGGRLAVVLQSPIGQVADFFNRFARYDVNVLDLWRDLIREYGEDNVDIRYFVNEIWTENLDDLVKIGLFLLVDRRFNSREVEIRDYLEERHRTPGGYRLLQDEILLAVNKPRSG